MQPREEYHRVLKRWMAEDRHAEVGGRFDHVSVTVGASHGADWFRVQITARIPLTTTLYLRRSELHALRCRLDEIDDTLPQPEEA